MDELFEKRVKKKLDPEEIRATVTRAGLYLVAFELLRYDVIESTKSFFLSGFDASGFTYSPRYAEKVLSLAPDTYTASAKWLVTMGAVTEAQAEELIGLRRHRNEIAHELPKLLIDPSAHLSPDLLERCRFYVELLGRFWGGVAADTNPDFDGEVIDYAGIRSGQALLLDVIWDAVHGSRQG